MILPTKRIPADRALLALGADVLLILSRPKTVSKVWEETKQRRAERKSTNPVPFDWLCSRCLTSLEFGRSIFEMDACEGLRVDPQNLQHSKELQGDPLP